MRRKIFLLLLLLACILFPLGWLRQFWPAYRTAFDAIFGPEWMHIVSHVFLFAGLGVLLPSLLPPPARRRLLPTLGLILLVGVLQETIQGLSSGNQLYLALFDLGVDLTGGLLGMAILHGLTVWNRQSSGRKARPVK